MDEVILRQPELPDAAAVWGYRMEMLAQGSSMDGCMSLHRAENAEDWIQQVRARERAENCPEGIVPSHQYILVRVSDGYILGMLQLRHHINHPTLSVWGGHIGYSVRPSERRKGYAAEMLRLSLEKCREMGLSRVLITCKSWNIGSEKTIRKCGGVYEKTVATDGGDIKRFWIALEANAEEKSCL